MINMDELQYLLAKVIEEENNLVDQFSRLPQFQREKEEVIAMKRRAEHLKRWLEEYESIMRKVHGQILLAASQEVVLYPPTVFGKSHFESLQEYQDLMLIKGKQVTQQ